MGIRLSHVGIACLVVPCAVCCVTHERMDVVEARRAHARCVEAHSATHPDCVALQERVLSAEERYEGNAQRAWGCDPGQPECPTPRE